MDLEKQQMQALKRLADFAEAVQDQGSYSESDVTAILLAYQAGTFEDVAWWICDEPDLFDWEEA